jgi:hypothetical protein
VASNLEVHRTIDSDRGSIVNANWTPKQQHGVFDSKRRSLASIIEGSNVLIQDPTEMITLAQR